MSSGMPSLFSLGVHKDHLGTELEIFRVLVIEDVNP